MFAISADNAPQTVIFEGDMLPAKAEYLTRLAGEILHKHRRDESDTRELTDGLIKDGAHPDLIRFAEESVLIGPEKDPPPGSVRHLLRRILPYSPWKSNARVVVFQNAAGIKDEAETALLKTLEEPGPLHYFFLSVQTADVLKETIRSRSVITRFVLPLEPEKLPADPWLRFYTLAQANDFIADFPAAAEKITAVARAAFDELTYTSADFPALENMLYLAPRQVLEKETVAEQTRALKFALLPVLAAVRDASTGGVTPAMAPVAVARLTAERALRLAGLMQNYMKNLEFRIFGNRPLNQHAVFYSFFFRFFEIWSER